MSFLKSLSLSTKVLLSLFIGVAFGLFFGERIVFLTVVGDIFIGLLQMTVLPYIMFSLIVNIGRLSFEEGKRLITNGAFSLIFLLIIGLIGLSFLPFALPTWGGGQFYSEDFIVPPTEFDFVKNYIPANLFESLTLNIVPAVVVFSIFLGLGLMAIPKKEVLLEPLDVLNKGLNHVNKLVVKLTPYGVFAIAAGIAGSMSFADLNRLQGYLLIYLLAVILYLFFILPAVIWIFTPFAPFKVLKMLRPTLITIFATGKIIVVFPQLIENIKEILKTQALNDEEGNAAVDVLMPLAYPFPNLGTFMIFVFVPFAAWYSGESLNWADYPAYLSSTLLSSFVAPITGLPFSLEMMGIPKDTFQLFVVSTVLTDRIRVVLGAFHLVVLTLLSVAGLKKIRSLNTKALITSLAVILLISFGSILGLKQLLNRSMQSIPTNKDIVNDFTLIAPLAPFKMEEKSVRNPSKKRGKENTLMRIQRRKTVRVGIYMNSIPFSFWNNAGELVGHSIDMGHQLAHDLKVGVEFVPIPNGLLTENLNKDHYDIILSDIFLTHQLASEVMVSSSFMEVSLALLVNKESNDFNDYSQVMTLDTFNIGFFERKDVSKEFQTYFPQARTTEIDSYDAFFKEKKDSNSVDGLITSAEKAYAFTVFNPAYKVVNPFPNPIHIDLVLPIAKDEVWRNYINSWIQYRKNDGTFKKMYNQWILGKPHQRQEKHWNMLDILLNE